MVAGILSGAVAAAVLAAGGSAGAAPDGYWMKTDGQFARAGSASSAALTYDRKLVPAGAWIEVGQHIDERGGTAVRLRVKGVKPGHTYGVHVHQKPCGANPADAGGHYQHRKDPVQPSTDPEYANPDNEIWLDFTADERGRGGAGAEHDWGFRRGEAASVVLHDQPGMSGSRVACFTVPFGWGAGTG
ncbi:superoxide dismutase family protein [Streptomyces sp. NPDC058371]|uniref:superoxide dismutase family protein n=1 Tax=Streptomyces sp. NPDC058371 TaxID=3346463 RepID=UPI003657C1E9